MRDRAKLLAGKVVYRALVLGVILSACQTALAGSSTSTLGVSLTITAGCSARTEATHGPRSTAVKCDNVVAYRLEFQPVTVAVVPENSISRNVYRDLQGINILVVYLSGTPPRSPITAF